MGNARFSEDFKRDAVHQITVRGYPVAEVSTAAGERAKVRMQELAEGKTVTCDLTGRKSYDRMIGECDLSDGWNLSAVMIREGYCRRWR